MSAALPYHLPARALIAVTGEDCVEFLQNLVTNDVRAAAGESMVYACLLSAQGRFLHDFFVLPRAGGGYWLDGEAGRKDDLLRRLSLYKLRARVALAAEEGWHVYAQGAGGEMSFPDPRAEGLGRRVYARAEMPARDAGGWRDLCISLGVPPDSGAMKPEKDFVTDLNLDLLHAVSRDKGCYVGQELTARMHYRGLAKKRLMIVTGAGLAAGDIIIQNSAPMGEVRAVDGTGGRGLALVRLESLGKAMGIEGKGEVKARLPPYFKEASSPLPSGEG